MKNPASACLILAALLAALPVAAENENTTIVLHAMPFFGGCSGTGDMDCETILPTIDVTGLPTPAIYVFLRNYDEVVGMQCAFDWPASWVFTFSLWACQPNQVNGITPSGPGPTNGTITTVFDPIAGGALALLGAMNYASVGEPGYEAGNSLRGCLEITVSTFPFGTHVINGSFEVTTIIPENWGAICLGPGGHDACEPEMPTPTESATWGAIKSQYR